MFTGEIFEQFRENIKKNTVTITEAEFIDRITEVLSEETYAKLFKGQPVLMMAFTVFATDIAKAIFHKGEDEQKQNESEVTE